MIMPYSFDGDTTVFRRLGVDHRGFRAGLKRAGSARVLRDSFRGVDAS